MQVQASSDYLQLIMVNDIPECFFALSDAP